jgi:hypothetical protein
MCQLLKRAEIQAQIQPNNLKVVFLLSECWRNDCGVQYHFRFSTRQEKVHHNPRRSGQKVAKESDNQEDRGARVNPLVNNISGDSREKVDWIGESLIQGQCLGQQL